MKKLLFLAVVVLSIVACKKTVFDPEGPTDIRIYNYTDADFSGLTVTMSDTTILFGDVPSHDTTIYHRFPKAFPKAEITCEIDGETYTTGPAPDIYMQYLGLNKITYMVYITNPTNKELSIYDVVYEEPLVLEEETEAPAEELG
jgi:hypothetical protein